MMVLFWALMVILFFSIGGIPGGVVLLVFSFVVGLISWLFLAIQRRRAKAVLKY